MKRCKQIGWPLLTVASVAVLAGCRDHMPHALTWPGGGDVQYTHAKPPEGGYYGNWDPFAVELEVKPAEAVNPVQTQHVLVATVKDKDGKPLPNRRVEWIIAEGSVGDIVEVDESGWRNSRGYKVTNHYAVSHTNNFEHVLDLGNDDPSDDIHLTEGQTWCVITSPIEGDTHVTVYAPGIYDWEKHKVFVKKHWYDVHWEFPPAATNPTGTTHELVTHVAQHSDGAPLANYTVEYRVVDGPPAIFESSGSGTAVVRTDGSGAARVTLKQVNPAEGTNKIQVDITRPGHEACCKPPVHIATGFTTKTWIGPKIAIAKQAPAQALANESFNYAIRVSNPSQVTANNVVVNDVLPDGIEYLSSSPTAQVRGQALSWSLGSLAAGGSQLLNVKVKATRTGRFNNCAEVTASQGLSASDCAPTIVTAPALAIDKQCPSEVTICDPINYTIVVRNTGDGPATNVKVVDQLPDGLVTQEGHTSVVMNVGTLNPGESKQGNFTVEAKRTGSFVNKATASADAGLTAEAECRTVVRQPVLTLVKRAPEVRYIGRKAQYEIVVTNTGDAPARDTVVVDTIPAGTEFIEAGQGGRFSNGQVTWNIGTLAPEESRTVTLKLKALQAGIARNTATAKAICAEASGSTEMTIKGIPAILLEVVDVEDPIEVGSSEHYVITVTNQGSAVGTNIRVECTLPPQEDYVSSDGPTQASVRGKTVTFAPLPSLAPKARVAYRVVIKGTAEGDVRFKVSISSDQTETPVEETESTHIY